MPTDFPFTSHQRAERAKQEAAMRAGRLRRLPTVFGDLPEICRPGSERWRDVREQEYADQLIDQLRDARDEEAA